MFRLHKEMSRLDIPAQRVLRLERSLSDVQVAIPGLPAQEATAYLCGFSSGQGLRVAVALQLHSSCRLTFYLNDEGEAPTREGTRIYNQALGFAESMGFMLGDLDIHLKSPEERIRLWKSLPLQSGLAAPPPVIEAPPKTAPSAIPPAPAAAPAKEPPPSPSAMNAGPSAQPSAPQGAENTFPPAVPRAGAPVRPRPVPGKSIRPSAPSSPPVAADRSVPREEPVAPAVAAGGEPPLSPPAPAELAAKRKELRENLGRFLASL